MPGRWRGCCRCCGDPGAGADAPVSPADAAARIAALEASLVRANAALAARDLLIDTLRGQIARLWRMRFGTSSEKLGREIEQLELALEELETERDAPVPEAADPGIAVRPAPVRSLPGHLPREEVVHEPASGTCTCPDCGGALRPLGSDAHEMLDIVPVPWRVVRVVRAKYSCRAATGSSRHRCQSVPWRAATSRWRTLSSPSSTTICRSTAMSR